MPVLIDNSFLIEQLCIGIDSSLRTPTPALRPGARFLEISKNARKEPQPQENFSKFIYFVHNIPGYEPSYFQKLIFAMAARVFSQKLMKNATPQQQLNALAKHGLKPIDVIFASVECGRRAGKTDAGTQITAGALVSAPNLTTLFLSLHEHTCKDACNSTYRWLCMAGYEKRCEKTNLSITMKGPGPTDISQIHFFTSHNPEVFLFFYFFLLISPHHLFAHKKNQYFLNF